MDCQRWWLKNGRSDWTDYHISEHLELLYGEVFVPQPEFQ
jgi:hypothetical protein